MGYQGSIAATTKYHDEEEELKALGVESTFNIYTEAGLGFANELASHGAERNSQLTALIGFNLGIEIGLLAIIVVGLIPGEQAVESSLAGRRIRRHW